MDSTFLGALIGGGFALAGSIVTAVATYFINTKQENKKVIREKKEAVYSTVEVLKSETTSKWTRLLNFVQAGSFEKIQNDNDKPSNLASLNMLLSLYFEEINDDRMKMNELYKELNLCFIKIFQPDSLNKQSDEFINEFLNSTHLLYREFIHHIHDIQEKIVNTHL